MQNKEEGKSIRLSHEVLGYLSVSAAISLFLFAFLYLTAISISEIYFADRHIELSDAAAMTLHGWIRSISFLSVLLFFIALFLTLLGQKFSYLREIIKGVDALRIHRMDYEVLVEGNDELTELAEHINYLSKTERRLAEQEARMTEERRQLIRALSHDIRNPLTAMLSYTEYLSAKENPDVQELRDCLDMVKKKSKQMKELTDILLESSDRKTEYFEDGHCLMLQLAEEWAEGLEGKFCCRLELEDCPRFCGEFDVRELQRIFDNLASNVEKYADESEEILLRIYEDGGRLCILSENAKKEVDEKTESHHIGLSSIRQIVFAYGGETEIQEDENRFRIQMTFQNVTLLSGNTDCRVDREGA